MFHGGSEDNFRDTTDVETGGSTDEAHKSQIFFTNGHATCLVIRLAKLLGLVCGQSFDRMPPLAIYVQSDGPSCYDQTASCEVLPSARNSNEASLFCRHGTEHIIHCSMRRCGGEIELSRDLTSLWKLITISSRQRMVLVRPITLLPLELLPAHWTEAFTAVLVDPGEKTVHVKGMAAFANHWEC